jgi:hypothetical protein
MNLKKIESEIKKIKQEIALMGEMRPGSLSKQYNVCGVKTCACKDKVNPKKHGPQVKLSFTLQGKSKSKFIKEIFVKKITKETLEYKKFKEIMSRWIVLEIERSDLQMTLDFGEKIKN